MKSENIKIKKGIFTKKDLVKWLVQDNVHLNLHEIKTFATSFIDALEYGILSGKRVYLPKIGIFSLQNYVSRKKLPMELNSDKIETEQSIKIKFEPSSYLKAKARKNKKRHLDQKRNFNV
jgi:nucleoid DNA-binding protein